ncbi:MAG: PAS domain S-box protein [Planctomycetia bacterium]|nr:PAS domain S-box protein [Planctomycetia bacterium]
MKKITTFKFVFFSFILLILLAIFILGILFNQTIKTFYINEKTDELKRIASLSNQAIDYNKIEDSNYLNEICYLISKGTQTRITLINTQGQVIADSHEDFRNMDNHADRPEIISAITESVGVSQRYSYTLEKEMLYLAILYNNNDHDLIIRTSFSISSLDQTFAELRIKMTWISIIILILGTLISFLIARKIVDPLIKIESEVSIIASGIFEKKIHISGTKEINSLVESLNLMRIQLEERINFITRQKDEHALILSSMIEGIIAIDNEDKVMRINNAALHLFNIPGIELIGKPIREVIRNADLLEFIHTISPEDSVNEHEITISSDKELIVLIKKIRMFDHNKTPLGVLLVLSDITQIKELEQINQDFVGNVSHELKTPITTVKGFVETLQDIKIKDKNTIRKYLGVIGQHTDRMNAIISDLLELSRIERGGKSLRKTLQKEKLLPVLEAAIQECEYQTKKKSIKIVLDCSDVIEVNHELGLLSYAVKNLIDNAIQYSDNNSTVNVSVEEKRSSVKIHIKDHGVGIDPIHFGRLFERFYRIDKDRSRKYGGTGLGLALVKHIIKIHDGSVTVDSHLGQGSLFTISLPN